MRALVIGAAGLLIVACGASAERPVTASAPVEPEPNVPTSAFDDDVALLRAHGQVIVLEDHGARVAVSPTYQARVMTSTIGTNGQSFGWIHRAFIAKGETGTAFDNFGGEDRFWLGPEGGQFGLYFAPGKPYAFDAWQVPHELQEGAWPLASPASATSATFTRAMTVTNHSGTKLSVAVERTVALRRSPDLDAQPGVRYVSFSTTNRVTNTGAAAWTEASGMPSIWILGMFAPAADARVVIPFRTPAIKDDYFGKVPPDRLKIAGGHLVFRCDGQYRSKIGVAPKGAMQIAASYSPAHELLTVVRYDPPPLRDGRYVNSAWEEQAAPFSGDVINSYNDGPIAPGKPSLGGFYEIETSSPALALAPGASFTHTQTTLHVTGTRAALDAVARTLVGMSLDDMQ
jgi:hypothetical protein